LFSIKNHHEGIISPLEGTLLEVVEAEHQDEEGVKDDPHN
jgi:hypothetical protein